MKTNFKIIYFFFFLLLGFVSFGQTKSQIKEITADYNVEKLLDWAKNSKKTEIKELKEAQRLAKLNNWPLTFIDENGAFNQLIKVSLEGKPLYYKEFNANAAKSTRAKFLHQGEIMGLNIEGQNMTAYVWDGNVVRDTHQEFNDGSTSRVTIMDTDNGNSKDHATHVSGTIIAYGSHPSAKGMAPQAQLKSFEWTSDFSEVTTETTNGMLLSNHSYGMNISDMSDWKIGAYTMESRRWDNLMFQAPYYQMVAAAGNDGYDTTSNGDPLEGNIHFDKLYDHVVSKNVLAIANGKDLSINSNGDVNGTIYIEGSSSQGPTDDLRVKPDITGNGYLLYSCVGTSDTAYDSYVGTSMASPNVTGSLLLLQQLYNQENGNFMLSATLRGLAKHTADEAGMLGPDAIFGWGYMNTKKAAECILEDGSTSLVREMDLVNNHSETFQVTSDGTNPLMASISWTDKGTNDVNFGIPNDPTPDIVNDLDIRITKNSTTYEPWKLTGVDTNTTGDNFVDNFERIDVPGASGVYTITVNHKGTLDDNHQAYSIVVTGITDNNLTTNEDLINSFQIWPNPCKGGYFYMNLEQAGTIEIKISNILGKVVSTNTYFNSNEKNKKIDISNLTSGVYIISVTGKRISKKLIIE